MGQNNIADIHSEESRMVLQILLQNGGEARFVGGCVRDYILGKPYNDIDIATSHKPEIVKKLFKERDIKVVPTGIDHGTVTIVIGKQLEDKKHYEITTLRKDAECDGRHAQVEFTNDWQEDAARRDFTFNSLSMDIDDNIYDYFNGQEDLENEIVCFVGDPSKRIQEDYLRILRLFRFQAYYSDEFDYITHIEACADNVEGLQQLSGERIQSEMLKILSAPNPLYVLTIMNKINVFANIIPNIDDEFDISPLEKLIEIENSYPDVISVNPYIRLAAMMIIKNSSSETLHDLSEHWRLSSDDRRYFTTIADENFELNSASDIAQQKKAIRKLSKEFFIGMCVLRWATELSLAKDEDEMELINYSYSEMIKLAYQWKSPIMPIRGRDLLDMGICAGKEIGDLLERAENHWEANDYRTTRDELLEIVQK